MIIEFLTDHPDGSVHDFEELLNMKSTRVKEILYSKIDTQDSWFEGEQLEMTKKKNQEATKRWYNAGILI